MKTTLLSTLLFLGFVQISHAQTPESNKQVMSRYFEEVINKQKPERLTEFISEDYVYYDLGNFTGSQGLQELKAIYPVFFKAFPDVHFTVENMIAEGDKIFVQNTFTATHKAEFAGFPATNNKVKITEMYFVTLKNSKMIEVRRLIDMANFTKQLSGK
ncbi:ester cyclase [Spirosoma arcticum]